VTQTTVFTNTALTELVASFEALLNIIIAAPTSVSHSELSVGAFLGSFLRNDGIFVRCFVSVAVAIRGFLYVRIVRTSSVPAAMPFLIIPRTHMLASLAVPKIFTNAFANVVALTMSGTNSSCHHTISIFTIPRVGKFSDVVFVADGEIIFFGPNGTRVLALDTRCAERTSASR
tara:strand:+ start:551 stop:1072 length:522 start_codon:yes stop_codon:yes gene_type:complete